MTIFDLYMMGKKEVKNKSDLILLFKSVFRLDRIGISLNSDLEVTDQQKKIFLNKLKKIKNDIPIHYVIGNVDFFDFNFRCGKGVFIPRKETELLVKEVIQKFGINFNGNIVDLCAGTGNVGISIKKALKKANVVCIEKSPEAFKYLEYNNINMQVDVKCVLGDIFDQVNEFKDNTFDVIVSNPPYVKTFDISYLDKNVQYEPRLALDGGNDGLDFYRKILSMWKEKLKDDGFFAFEIGYDQYEDMGKIIKNENLKNIKFIKDYNGYNRICICF